jgi:hypothetical protein
MFIPRPRAVGPRNTQDDSLSPEKTATSNSHIHRHSSLALELLCSGCKKPLRISPMALQLHGMRLMIARDSDKPVPAPVAVALRHKLSLFQPA